MKRSLATASQAKIEPLEARELFAVNPTVVDVAVYYTPAARNSVGGVESLSRRVDRAIADTNYILANSRVDATVRLVWFGEANYQESFNLSTDLSRLQNPSDGYLDAVHAQRTTRGADLVHLLVADGDDGGRAYQLDDESQSWPEFGFAVSQARYSNVEYIFAHETMHNLGAGHDDADTSSRQLPYAYGMAVKSGLQTVYTLMGPGNRIPYLSSQDLTWRGQFLGAAMGSARAVQLGHAADNARVVREFLPGVSSNRVTKVSDTAAPAAQAVQSWVDPSGKTLNLQLALADDRAINVASLDGGDLRIAGPNGFSKTATFAAIDRATNGSQRLARYTVNVTGFPADPSLYTATLNAGQITDIGGRSVPGGVINLSASTTRFADRAGPNLRTSMELGTIDGTNRSIEDSVSDVDTSNFYRFTLTSATTVSAKLVGLTGNANLYLLRDGNGNGMVDGTDVLASSSNAGSSPEQLSRSLTAGVYYVWVAPVGGAVTAYSLALRASVTGAPPSPPSQTPSTTGKIQGALWSDNNSNGVRDSWETGLSGWSVYADVNGNGAYDTGDVQATTDASGIYTLANLPPRTYVVRSIDRAGFRHTTAASISVSVVGGQIAGGKNFGHTTRGLVSGSVYIDANGNHLRDTSEAGASGWTVFLDKNSNSRFDDGESWTTTDSAGAWSMKTVLPGSYVVRLVAKAGYSSVPAGSALTLQSGQIVSGKNFGVRKI